MQQTWYVNGTLWGAADTAVWVGRRAEGRHRLVRGQPEDQRRGQGRGPGQEAGLPRPGEQQPDLPGDRDGRQRQGRHRVHGGRRRLLTRAPGYATIDANGSVGPIHIAAAGLGPDDGFTSYKAFVGDPPRTRWGDYGAAVTDGSSIWIASEYIDQTCTWTSTSLAGRSGAATTPARRWPTGAPGSARSPRDLASAPEPDDGPRAIAVVPVRPPLTREAGLFCPQRCSRLTCRSWTRNLGP